MNVHNKHSACRVGDLRENAAEERYLLRKKILSLRDRLDLNDRKTKSRLILRHLLDLPFMRESRTIFTYVHFRSEPETDELIRDCLSAGKKVAVPLTVSTDGRIEPRLISSPAKDLAPGFHSIPEPLPHTVPKDPKEIDIVITPGSVFDEGGGRLGYGGGYYDRFFAMEAPEALRVGIAFEIQVVKRIPLLPHDVPVHILVTEKGPRFFYLDRVDNLAKSRKPHPDG